MRPERRIIIEHASLEWTGKARSVTISTPFYGGEVRPDMRTTKMIPYLKDNRHDGKDKKNPTSGSHHR